ncbi:glycoside hydrolase [Aspergillus heteromorphus CBS 117.55]|uniref:Alpha-glucuronidase n=1 Tax=Aspergillus heteromorphus CBS 117.55 TaxID=1448321 RepID=A0A317VYH4_9EURO|nr:glycoside hydrolase [Aspergillus heteromorphus CBS 117.55]PWY79323.1 glycoside hydrolase [Aspergillus heteromorphus CBS 117.55]
MHCQQALPSRIVLLNSTRGSPIETAGQELKQGLDLIVAKNASVLQSGCDAPSLVLVATVNEYPKICIGQIDIPALDEDGFRLQSQGGTVRILGQNARGTLYGAYEYLSMLAQRNFSHVAYATSPHAPIRWVNQLDNMDGSIEGGYGGASIFFKDGTIVDDLAPIRQYARLLASIRVKAVVVNNVNAIATLLSSENKKGLARIADACRPYGVQIGISLNFASPEDLGGLDTYDPLDPSEQTSLRFDDNVVVQIKYGPIDFQVREPPSPLFANLYHTNTAIELEVTQEYLGQHHLSMSNLYAYGRLAWSPTIDSEQILTDWTRLTFGQIDNVINTINDMSMASWSAYENYTGNLGIQTLTNMLYTDLSVTLAHTTIGCGEQGFPSAQPYLSHTPGANRERGGNCAEEDTDGCDANDPRPTSFETAFNNNGGGVYAMEWKPDWMRVWCFPGNDMPSGTSGPLGPSPDPNTWGPPTTSFDSRYGTDCSMVTHIKEQRIIIDTTFCGQWASVTWSSSGYAASTGYSTCEAYVKDVPSAFRDAFWTFKLVKTYT